MEALLIVGPIIIAFCFYLVQKRKKDRRFLLFSWGVITLLSVAIGAVLWSPSDEISQFGTVVLIASPASVLGPLLLSLSSKRVPLVALCFITLAVPMASVIAVWFLLAASGHIWGM